MSKLLVPKHYAQSSVAENIKSTAKHRLDSDDFVTPMNVAQQLDDLQGYLVLRRQEEPEYKLPQPSGWKLMVLMLTIPETSDGGVIVVDDAKEQRALASPQGVILAMGPAAYTDRERFTVEGELVKWHAVGDRITLVKYDASMFQIANGQRLGLLNDTQPIATIDTGWEVPA